MTEFKVGDRLRGTATGSDLPNGEIFEGEYRGDPHSDGWVKVYGQDDYWWLDKEFPITVVSSKAPKLSFVGPEPEPAEAPAVTTPFGKNDYHLVDSRGNHLAYFDGLTTTERQDGDLLTLVVKLLNEHFGVGQ